MLAEGYSYKARAAALDIGMDTVRSHIRKSTSGCTCTRARKSCGKLSKEAFCAVANQSDPMSKWMIPRFPGKVTLLPPDEYAMPQLQYP
jgi:hypothetical protein